MVIIAIRIIHKWVERLQVSLVGINHAQIYRECDESRFFFLMSRYVGLGMCVTCCNLNHVVVTYRY